MSKEEIQECIRCGTPQEYNGYLHFWYCPNPDCPPGRSRFPFNLAEEMLKLEKENKEKKNQIKLSEFS